MLITRKTKIFSMVGCVTILFVLSMYIYNEKSSSIGLSADRIHELRQEYPSLDGEHATYHMKKQSFQDVTKLTETIITAEVVGELPEYVIDLTGLPNTPEDKINQKRKQNGLPSLTATFSQYEVKVLETVNGKPVTGNIKLVYNSAFRGIEPDLKKGMKIVTAISAGKLAHEGKFYFTRFGTYYIVDNDYVLSAVDDEFSVKMNGRPLKEFIDEISTISLPPPR
ncbi:hypothetical protein [Paenibacillus taiwanensis]|uniref:hypothetical protein n=1 Tax=Paenibacillus taiwanensis TaxID=401638 RepID=UPI00040F0FB0|nr:hypothetical protein [Paenibacillus taiwanensis]